LWATEAFVVAILVPPKLTDVEGPLVFLAGPIQGAPDWQTDALRWFQTQAPNLAIASPRHAYAPGEFDYIAQVEWETYYLRRAAQRGVILFWLAREVVSVPNRCYGQTTRFELAEWKVRHERDGVPLVVGIEEGFSGARYIRHRLRQDCPAIPLVESLEQACRAAVELIYVDAAGRSGK
jgi:hypothetical protein